MGKISGWPKSSLGLFHNILQENPNKLFGQSSTKLPFSLLKEVFHADFTHVLPSKASQPNSLHGAFSEVRQAEREPRFLITLRGGFHSLLHVQASHAQRAWLSSLFPQELVVRTQAFPISCSTRSEEEGFSEHQRMSSADRRCRSHSTASSFRKQGFLGSSVVKKWRANAEAAGDMGSITRSGRSPGGEMATHSVILAWKIPRTEEPGMLQIMGLKSLT